MIESALNESRQDKAGSENVLARLSELMFVQVVREHLESLPPGEGGWLAALRDPVVGKALLALVITGLTWGGFIAGKAWAASEPPVYDVATDWTDPLMFSPAVLKARGPGANPVEPAPVLPIDVRSYAGRAVADVNAETCAGARPALLNATPDQAYAAARAAVVAAGLTLVSDDPAAGRLEATATSLLYGFKDDVVVRVKAEGEKARVDARSTSRVRTSDLGANCRRVEALMAALG